MWPDQGGQTVRRGGSNYQAESKESAEVNQVKKVGENIPRRGTRTHAKGLWQAEVQGIERR